MNTIGKMNSVSLNQDIMELDWAHFPRPWTKEQWEGLDLAQHKILEWKKGDQLIGFALFGVVPGDDLAHLYKILIHPNYHGTGEAQDFWKEITQFLKKQGIGRIYLEVEESNVKATRFYGKLGFQLLRKIKGYYSNGEAALTMDYSL